MQSTNFELILEVWLNTSPDFILECLLLCSLLIYVKFETIYRIVDFNFVSCNLSISMASPTNRESNCSGWTCGVV
jgi:hypothetical protein